MGYSQRDALKHRIGRNKKSIRQAAHEIGMSHSSLAKILRGGTENPTTHVDLAIQRWLYPESTFDACMCSRCQGHQVSLQERVDILEKNTISVLDRLESAREEIQRLMERVEELEQTTLRQARSISPFIGGI